MPQAAPVFAAIASAAKGIGAAVTGASAATLAAAAAVSSIAISSYQAKKAEADARKDASRAPRDITVRSAIEPARIIYGQARTSGPVVYTNTAETPGTSDNSTLWTVISLCQHEIEDITAIWLDGDEVTAIDWRDEGGTGGVTSGTYGPIGSNEVTHFYRHFGTDTQTHETELSSTFSDWTSAYDGKGIAYIVCAFELGTATGEGVWAQGAPQNIRAVIKGKKLYDPRLDSTQTGIPGSGSHRLNDSTTWEWSDNPALCVADYLHDSRLGMGAEGITYNDIDWELVASAADDCDVSVDTPGGSQKRFTCNGAISTEETYAENIRMLLSSMGGSLTWSGGKFRIRALAYEAPTYSFTGDDIIGDIQIQPETNRSQRFNLVRGTFIDPDSDYVATEFIPVENTAYKNTRDGGQSLNKQIKLPFTNDEYMAQRIAFKQLNVANQQMRCIVPMNWKAMKVAVGDRIQLSVDELGWSAKPFLVEGWQFEPEGGYNLTLQEDSNSAYNDPASPGDYSTRTLAGTVSFADQAVSAPSGLSATSEEVANLLEWDAPPRASGYDEIAVYASATSEWSGATEIGRTRGTTFRHELAHGTQRYYWVRAIDVDGRESIRSPASDTSGIQATSGQISTSELNDDASFAGAQVGDNLRDEDGTTILGKEDVKNNEITDLFLEDGTLLNDEGGNPIVLNTVGDSAITVRNSLDGVEANYSVKIDLNGRVSGFGLIATEATATPFSAFAVIADQFAVVDPDSTASNPIVPFSVSGDKAVFTTDVTINGDLLTTGTISADRLSIDGVTLDTSGGQLIIANNGVGSDQLASGAVDIAKFASGLQPIQVVDTLPGSAAEGDQAYLTTDNKLYRYNGSAWIKAVDGADVTSGTLPASAIVANSITAGQIEAGAIGATEISVTNLAAINSDLGTLTAGTIDASAVSVTNLTATNITTGTLNADRLSIDGVMFDTSAGELIIKDAGVGTDQVSDNAISETFSSSAGTMSTSGTTLTDTGLSLTVTIPAGATIQILINYDFQVTGSASTDKANTRLYEDTLWIRGATHAAGNTDHAGTGVYVLTRTNTTGSASTRTYKMQTKTASASTTVQISEQYISITELKK